MYLFVYGTLKSDGRSSYLKTSKFISNAATVDKFALYPNLSHYYPCLVEHPLYHIQGELYEVDKEILIKLDIYEGAPTLFKQINIQVTDGTNTYDAITYLIADKSEVSFDSDPLFYWNN